MTRSTTTNARRLRGLESKPYWPEIRRMIEEEVPVSEIVAYLMVREDARGDYTSESLRVMIYVKAKEIRMKQEGNRRREEITYHLGLYGQDYVEPEVALQTLGFIAFDRVLMQFNQEQCDGKNDVTNIQNIKIAKEIWESIAKIQIDRKKANVPMINLNTQNNIIANMDKVKEQFAQRYGTDMAQTISDPESRRKILDALEKVRNIGKGPISEILLGSKKELDS